MSKLYFNIGDTVHVNVSTIINKPEFDVVITKIIVRYGKFNGERDNLIKGKLIIPYKCEWTHKSKYPCFNCNNTGMVTEKSFSEHYITNIIKRCNKSINTINNIYTEHEHRNTVYLMHKIDTEQKSVWCGTLFDLISNVLSKLYKNIDRDINVSKAQNLYMKNHIGLIKSNDHIFYVNKKRFSMWVIKNIDKLLYTAKQMDDMALEEDKQIEEIYNNDFEYAEN